MLFQQSPITRVRCTLASNKYVPSIGGLSYIFDFATKIVRELNEGIDFLFG